jgi:hypothetical protein
MQTSKSQNERVCGHILIINKDAIPRKAMNKSMKGQYPRGKPRYRWERQARKRCRAEGRKADLRKKFRRNSGKTKTVEEAWLPDNANTKGNDLGRRIRTMYNSYLVMIQLFVKMGC